MTTDALGYSENDIVLGTKAEGDIADLVLAAKDLSHVDVMSINSASLRRDGEKFVASVNIYDDEILEVTLTREDVLEALGWDNI